VKSLIKGKRKLKRIDNRKSRRKDKRNLKNIDFDQDSDLKQNNLNDSERKNRK
jgi:hypothetical protein